MENTGRTMKEEELYTLVYVSYAKEDLDAEDLDRLWKSSFKSNKSLGITGMLVYLNKRFLQVLEGDRKKVEKLFARIQKDRRHEGVMLLLDGPLEKRNFEDWAMGFCHLNSDQEILHRVGMGVLRDLNRMEINKSDHPALQFLKMFFDKQVDQEVPDFSAA